MNKKKLLEEILDSPGTDDLRNTSLEVGLRAIRVKRRGRAVVRYGAAVVLVLGISVAGALHILQKEGRPSAPVISFRAPDPAASKKDGTSAKVEIITADQLLALFPNRPVALVGEPGRQRLVLQDGAGPGGGHPQY